MSLDYKLIGGAFIAFGVALGGVNSAAPAPKGGTATKDKAPEAVAEDAHGIEYETVSALVVRLSKEKGRDVAVNFLKGFKNPANGKPATKGAEIGLADYPEAVEKATALLEEEPELG